MSVYRSPEDEQKREWAGAAGSPALQSHYRVESLAAWLMLFPEFQFSTVGGSLD